MCNRFCARAPTQQNSLAVDESFSRTTSENTSLDQDVGETSLSPNCTVKVCRFHQPWNTEDRGGPKFCSFGANCQDLHVSESLANKKALELEQKASARRKAEAKAKAAADARIANVTCHNCREKGHYANRCPNPSSPPLFPPGSLRSSDSSDSSVGELGFSVSNPSVRQNLDPFSQFGFSEAAKDCISNHYRRIGDGEDLSVADLIAQV